MNSRRNLFSLSIVLFSIFHSIQPMECKSLVKKSVRSERESDDCDDFNCFHWCSLGFILAAGGIVNIATETVSAHPDKAGENVNLLCAAIGLGATGMLFKKLGDSKKNL